MASSGQQMLGLARQGHPLISEGVGEYSGNGLVSWGQATHGQVRNGQARQGNTLTVKAVGVDSGNGEARHGHVWLGAQLKGKATHRRRKRAVGIRGSDR